MYIGSSYNILGLQSISRDVEEEEEEEEFIVPQ